MFSMGVCDIFLLSMNSPDNLEHEVPLKFSWHGREADTGDSMSEAGEVSIMDDRMIRGIFHDMYGHVDFTGRRKFMPSNVSSYEPWYYSRSIKICLQVSCEFLFGSIIIFMFI
jgi:hypothetical protein